MNRRIAVVIPALAAVVGGVLTAAPAEAASSSLQSRSIAISSSGKGQVAIKCSSRSACRGTLEFAGGGKKTKYVVRGKQTSYAKVAMNPSSSANPHNGGRDVGGQYKRKSATLKVNGRSVKVTTETQVSAQQITGTVNGPGGEGNVGPVRVELVSIDRGGNTKVERFANDLANGAAYSFNVPLGPNNSPSPVYRIRIVGPTTGDDVQSWFWRGKDGVPSTGGRYLRDATAVQATKSSDFNADFRYSSIFGTAPVGTRLTVAAAPPSYAGGKDVRRELDIAECANIFATTTASTAGTYRVNFLPFASGDRRFMVAARNGSNERWNNSFGSCLDVQDYGYSRANMLALDPAGLNYPVAVGPSNNNLLVDGAFAGFKPTSEGDRWVSIREVTPGVPILASPIIAERQTSTSGKAQFNDLPPGSYFVELGRRTGCADWYPSKFSNNRSYFKGLDRTAERWKIFSTLSALPGNKNSGYEYLARTANPNPATSAEQGKRPRGFAGWMYRTHCKALGYGTIKTVNIAGLNNGNKTVNLRSKKGAVVRGHVSRAKGRTTKEMMVTLSSSDGKRVLRTDLTDGKGNFYVAGLAPGRYKITVNPDSWRGIGRTFKGRHFITVRAGRTYGAGNLRFTD